MGDGKVSEDKRGGMVMGDRGYTVRDEGDRKRKGVLFVVWIVFLLLSTSSSTVVAETTWTSQWVTAVELLRKRNTPDQWAWYIHPDSGLTLSVCEVVMNDSSWETMRWHPVPLFPVGTVSPIPEFRDHDEGYLSMAWLEFHNSPVTSWRNNGGAEIHNVGGTVRIAASLRSHFELSDCEYGDYCCDYAKRERRSRNTRDEECKRSVEHTERANYSHEAI